MYIVDMVLNLLCTCRISGITIRCAHNQKKIGNPNDMKVLGASKPKGLLKQYHPK